MGRPMLRTVLCLLVIVFVPMSRAVYGDDILYCIEEDSNGFHPNEKNNNKYARSGFVTGKFTLKLSIDNSQIIINKSGEGASTYKCSIPYRISPDSLSCTQNFDHFSFNKTTGNFVRASIYGHAQGKDSVFVIIGHCSKF